MVNIRRILCPTDLTSESDESLRYAVALTSAYDAKLLLLYCKEDPSSDGVKAGKAGIHGADSLFTESLAPHLGLKSFQDFAWQSLVVENVENIGKAIVDEAVTQQSDLIVMRSRRRPHAAVLLGSTAETVCRTAPCPVLVTHPLEREWVGFSTGEIDLHRVLIAHDFSPDSQVALNFGVSLAEEYQAEVHLLHVLSSEGKEEPELAWSTSKTGNAYTLVSQKLQHAIPREAFLWCNCVNAVRCGKASDEIVSYAKEHEIDLICIGASGNEWSVDKLFGSNVDRVLRQAPCPVLVARPIKGLTENLFAGAKTEDL
jgi:nucleotide-binding universal stress UspA family protein